MNRLNFQPSTSSAAASPANAPQISIIRIYVRPTLIPAYAAASGLKPTARTS